MAKQAAKYSNEWWAAKKKAQTDRFLAAIKRYGSEAAMSQPRSNATTREEIYERLEYFRWRLRKHEHWWGTATDAEKVSRYEEPLRRQVEEEQRNRERGEASRKREGYPPITGKFPGEKEMEHLQADPMGYAKAKYESERNHLIERRDTYSRRWFQQNGPAYERKVRQRNNKSRRVQRRHLRNAILPHLEYLVFRVKRKAFKTMRQLATRYNKPMSWVEQARWMAIDNGLITEEEWKTSFRQPGRPRKGKPRGPYRKTATS